MFFFRRPSRHPFRFYAQFLDSGKYAKNYQLPHFCNPETPLPSRLEHFRSRLDAHFRGFFSLRGKFDSRRLAADAEFMKRQLWHSSALLGFLEDPRTRFDLKDGKIPTLVRFERPSAPSLHDRVIQNIPLFGVSTAALVNLGVPLPWNMMGAGFAAAVREFADNFRSHHEFESRLREEFKKTGRDPQTYLDLYAHLDHLIPHPISRSLPELSFRLRGNNYSCLKAFHAKLDEVHQFAGAYLTALRTLQDAVHSGTPPDAAVASAVDVAVTFVQDTKQSRSDLEPMLRKARLSTLYDRGLIEPSASPAVLDALGKTPMVQRTKQRIERATKDVEESIRSSGGIRMDRGGTPKRRPSRRPKPKK